MARQGENDLDGKLEKKSEIDWDCEDSRVICEKPTATIRGMLHSMWIYSFWYNSPSYYDGYVRSELLKY